MTALLIMALVAVLFLYGRSVAGTARHALREVLRHITLVLGLLFIASMLALLFFHT